MRTGVQSQCSGLANGSVFRWKKPVLVFGLALFGLCWFASLAAAQDYYGAIAYSEADNAWGYSRNYSNREEAEQRALDECAARGSGCRVLVWFVNACGALAVANNGAYGSGWGSSLNRAYYEARKVCEKHGGSDCDIKCSVCTSR
jgi:hypothetical protein